MKYLWGEKFTVPMGGDETYRANWDAIFAKKEPTPKLVELMATLPVPEPMGADMYLFREAPEAACPCESGSSFADCHGTAGDNSPDSWEDPTDA